MIGLASALLGQGCAAASVGVARFVSGGAPDLTGWAVARETPLLTGLSYETRASLRHGDHGLHGLMLGVGADLTVLAGRAGAPYLIGGVDVGVGSRDHPDTWASWSLGGGGEIWQVAGMGIRLEGRYRRMSAMDRRGLDLGIRIGGAWGRPGAPARLPEALPAPALTVPRVDGEVAGGGEAGERRAAVVSLALQAMGTPYRWGGTDANGFDCSGLIQFAYGERGIVLPRRSEDQARAGQPVERELARLLPGDILSFATARDGRVNHVGLYLGEGRFLHSATGGVQVSVLNAEDPYGRWWWQRWVGARRVVP